MHSWNICLTGAGQRELEMCTKVAKATQTTNLCDQLNWTNFVLKIQEARMLITVDTAAVHIAAASLTPTVALYAGMNSPPMWIPPSPACKSLIKRVMCAPCFQRKGCAQMTCIRGIEVDEVYRAALSLSQKDRAIAEILSLS